MNWIGIFYGYRGTRLCVCEMMKERAKREEKALLSVGTK